MQHGFVWCPHCGSPHPLGTTICPLTAKSLDRSLAKEPDHPLIGTVVGGKYIIRRVIGSGGMGTVFETENRALRRLVALKLVDSLSTTPEAAKRLEQEAALISAIQHPNICDLYDIGVMPDGSPYLVLERLFGENLAALLSRQRRLPVDVAFELFTQLLSGLHAAHGARVIHRDIKPANIFLVDRIGCPPLVKIVDFGFAKDVSGVRMRTTTQPSQVLGTLRYMAPEVLERAPVDHRADLFGVGLVMYEALTGEIPFKNPMEKGDTPPGRVAGAFRTLRPDVPDAVGDVIARALAKAPEDRFASAIELQSAFADALGKATFGSDSGPPSSMSPSSF